MQNDNKGCFVFFKDFFVFFSSQKKRGNVRGERSDVFSSAVWGIWIEARSHGERKEAGVDRE
jgi:hypothetical protein